MEASQMYPYIFDFLLKCGHSRAAEALVKDAKLDTKKMKTLAKDKDLIGIFEASKKSATQSASALKKSAVVNKKLETSSSSDSGSDSGSDSDQKSKGTKKQAPAAVIKTIKLPVVQKVVHKPAATSSASRSDSSSSSDDSDSEESTVKPVAKKVS